MTVRVSTLLRNWRQRTRAPNFPTERKKVNKNTGVQRDRLTGTDKSLETVRKQILRKILQLERELPKCVKKTTISVSYFTDSVAYICQV